MPVEAGEEVEVPELGAGVELGRAIEEVKVTPYAGLDKTQRNRGDVDLPQRDTSR